MVTARYEAHIYGIGMGSLYISGFIKIMLIGQRWKVDASSN